MCGICGIVNFSSGNIELGRIEAMTQIMSYRGPDDSGIYCKDGIGLGHRRLSIIDLSAAGHQPMTDEGESVWIVFNGEIYNFRELKQLLLKKGHKFKSNSDTEVILHGYLEWGEGCWEKLDGMFAIAVWDNNKKKISLVRDPFGIKPLYYSYKNNRLVFASEIKSMLASGFVEKELNFRTLSNFLTYFYTPGPETIIKDILHVQPGNSTVIDGSNVKINKYWQLSSTENLSGYKDDEILDMLRQETREAVKKTLLADVPVGLLLSGGVDSNIILSELIELGYSDIRTFTVGFKELSYDESDAVRKRIQGTGIKSEILYVEDNNVTEIFDDMVYHLDSLNANVANIAEYFIFKTVSSHVKVALAGAGNDELFAGYETYIADRYRPFYRMLPKPLRSTIRYIARHLPQTEQKYSFDYLLEKFTEGAEFPPAKSHYWWRTILTDSQKNELFNKNRCPSEAFTDSFYVYDALYNESKTFSSFETRSLYADLFLFCNENANMMVDNLSMAFSLEVRPPFLTKRFVEFAFQVPYRLKLKGRKTKYCLRKAYENQLPDYIVWKKKEGLVSPIPQLIRGQLKEKVLDNFSDTSSHPYFNKKYMEKLVNDHMNGVKDHGFEIYVLFTFLRWYELFIKN